MKLLCAIGILIAFSILMADGKFQTAPGQPVENDAVCPPSGDYHVFLDSSGYSLPDIPGTFLFLGPIDVPDVGATILDVVVSANATHTRAGDVFLGLGHDIDENGTLDSGTELLCRPGFAGCDPFAGSGCCGCFADLPGGLYWGLGSPASVDAICGGGFIAPGCYLPDPESVGLGVFPGEPSDGDWYLVYSDGAGGDSGFLDGWGLAIKYDYPTATGQTTWSAIKAIYR